LYLRRAQPEAPPITGGSIKLKFGMNLQWVKLHGSSPAELKILTSSWVFIKIKGHFELICIKLKFSSFKFFIKSYGTSKAIKTI